MSTTQEEQLEGLKREIAQGFEFEELLRDARMQRLNKMSDEKREQLLEQLLHTPASNTSAIVEIQQKVYAIDHWQDLIAGVIQRGINAQEEFTQLHSAYTADN